MEIGTEIEKLVSSKTERLMLQESFNEFEAIALDWSKRVASFQIKDENDTEGVEKANQALKLVASKRIALEKKRKELKEDSLNYGRAIDSVAKRISEMFQPIETDLKSKADFIKNIQAKKRAELLSARLELIAPYGVAVNNDMVADMDQDVFDDYLEGTIRRYEARIKEEKRIQAETAKAEKEQAKKLEDERKAKDIEIKRLNAEIAETKRVQELERKALEQEMESRRLADEAIIKKQQAEIKATKKEDIEDVSELLVSLKEFSFPSIKMDATTSFIMQGFCNELEQLKTKYLKMLQK